MLLVYVHHWFTSSDVVHDNSAWESAFNHEMGGNNLPIVKVRLNSGKEWIGFIETYNIGLKIADREIVLRVTEGEWRLVVIPAVAIESIAVRWSEDVKLVNTSRLSKVIMAACRKDARV